MAFLCVCVCVWYALAFYFQLHGAFLLLFIAPFCGVPFLLQNSISFYFIWNAASEPLSSPFHLDLSVWKLNTCSFCWRAFHFPLCVRSFTSVCSHCIYAKFSAKVFTVFVTIQIISNLRVSLKKRVLVSAFFSSSHLIWFWYRKYLISYFLEHCFNINIVICEDLINKFEWWVHKNCIFQKHFCISSFKANNLMKFQTKIDFKCSKKRNIVIVWRLLKWCVFFSLNIEYKTRDSIRFCWSLDGKYQERVAIWSMFVLKLGTMIMMGI